MSCRLKLTACIFVATTAWLSGNALLAEVTYDANTDFVANYDGLYTTTYGTWSCGYRNGVTGTNLTLFTDAEKCSATWAAFPGAEGGGWHHIGGVQSNLPELTANVGGSDIPFGNAFGGYNTWWKNSFNMSEDVAGYVPVLRWTSPQSGTISTVSTGYIVQQQTHTDISLVLDGVLLTTASLAGGTSSADISLSGVAVQAGSVLDFVVSSTSGYGNASGGNMTGVFHSVTLVPEPTAIMMLCTGMMGLFCYAWRKQR
jgi:hypothetical protein